MAMGGHYFTMTFGSDGQVKMLGDYSEEASSKPQVSTLSDVQALQH